MTQRELSRMIGLSARQIGRLTKAGVIPQRRDGSYDPAAISSLLKHYKARLRIAEGLCRRFLGDELADRYEDVGLR